jgi:hypothetical protein
MGCMNKINDGLRVPFEGAMLSGMSGGGKNRFKPKRIPH